jgi:hypothetical protein
MTRARYAFTSRLGSVTYGAVTYDETGHDLPQVIDGNEISWSRVGASDSEISLVSTADMERDLHEVGLHITETRTKPRESWHHPR